MVKINRCVLSAAGAPPGRPPLVVDGVKGAAPPSWNECCSSSVYRNPMLRLRVPEQDKHAELMATARGGRSWAVTRVVCGIRSWAVTGGVWHKVVGSHGWCVA